MRRRCVFLGQAGSHNRARPHGIPWSGRRARRRERRSLPCWSSPLAQVATLALCLSPARPGGVRRSEMLSRADACSSLDAVGQVTRAPCSALSATVDPATSCLSWSLPRVLAVPLHMRSAVHAVIAAGPKREARRQQAHLLKHRWGTAFGRRAHWPSQRSLHNAPIFRLLLKVAVNGTHQCDFLNFCGATGSNECHRAGVLRL